MKKTTMTVAVGVVAFASVSQAQLGSVPSIYTLGWTSYAGCSMGPTMLTLPNGGSYYLPSVAPSSVGVGACSFGSANSGVNVLTGWLGIGNGYMPPPPASSIGGAQSSSNDDNANDEPLTPNPHVVNSTETHPAGGGDTRVQEFAPIAPPPITTTPEPASLVLVGSGLAGLAGLAWRRRQC